MRAYEEFFGMEKAPFQRDMPVKNLFMTDAMKEALGRLQFIAEDRGFAVVLAEPGCGKSTLIRKYAASLDPNRFIYTYLSDSKLTPRWLYKGMLDQLGGEAHFYRGDSKRELQKQIAFIQNVSHKKVVCVLDEAHLLEREVIEEFRFLLNTNFDSEGPMALVLVGQNELWDNKLRLQRYAAVRQRIDLYCSLPRLSRSETGDYIRYQIRYSQCGKEIFTEDALGTIYDAAGGIMRVINQICKKCLMYASQVKQTTINADMVRYVVQHEIPAMDDPDLTGRS